MTTDIWNEAQEIESERVRWTEEETLKPIIGQKVEGILLSKKIQPNPRSDSPGASSTVYEIATTQGTKWFYGMAILDRKLEGQKGRIVRIEVTGQTKTQKGNMATTFSVRVLPNNAENRMKLGLDAVGEEVGKDEKPEDGVDPDKIPW